MTDSLTIAGRQFRSRLIVGTGKYKSGQETATAIESSGAEMVTVAVRRVNLDRSKESLLDFIDPKRYFLLPKYGRLLHRRRSHSHGASRT
jgi:thiazole synthase